MDSNRHYFLQQYEKYRTNVLSSTALASLAEEQATSSDSHYQPQHFLMCAPEYFDVTYVINPWMDTSVSVDRDRALRQWHRLVTSYQSAGHAVSMIDPQPDLPDMVYAANGATMVDGNVMLAKFAVGQRAGEQQHYQRWHHEHAGELGSKLVTAPTYINEGEGDFIDTGRIVLAGYGFRSDPRSHTELAEVISRPVVGLQLVSPWFYHLDTALAVLRPDPYAPDVAWFPGAFSPASQHIIRTLFPDALEVAEVDARVLGINLVSDGHHVWIPRSASGLRESLALRGYAVIEIELDELLKGGGSIKCCTQTLRSAP